MKNDTKMKKILKITLFIIFIISCIAFVCVAFVCFKGTDEKESGESVGETVSESETESQLIIDSTLFTIKAVDGGCEIVGVKTVDVVDQEGVLTIPHKVNGINVVTIKSLTSGALDVDFSFLNRIKQVAIPFSVKEISAGAFANLPNLVAVIFEDESKLTSIGNGAFENCISLTDVKLGEKVERVYRRKSVINRKVYY